MEQAGLLLKELRGITVVAVTKNRSPEEIQKLFDQGFRVFGENRMKEALSKWRDDPGLSRLRPSIQLHFIGHLQTNKVADALASFDMIQSVDSTKLLAAIDLEARKQSKVMPVLLQVNISKDPKKFGIAPDELFEFLKQAHSITTSGHVRIEGLMTIGEPSSFEDRRFYFRKLKKLFDEVSATLHEGHIEAIAMKHLSMGMSEDFRIAVEEGSTMVRLGRVLFEGKNGLS